MSGGDNGCSCGLLVVNRVIFPQMEQHRLEGWCCSIWHGKVFAIVRLVLVRELLSLKEKPVCLKPSKVVCVSSSIL